MVVAEVSGTDTELDEATDPDTACSVSSVSETGPDTALTPCHSLPRNTRVTFTPTVHCFALAYQALRI